MKRLIDLRTAGGNRLLCVGVLAASCAAYSLTAQETSADAAKAAPKKGLPTLEVPKSRFTNDYKQAVDPFFPKSLRRHPPPPKPIEPVKPVVVEVTPAEPPPPPKPPDPFDDLSLKAVIGGSRPLATIATSIKNYYMAPGEWRMVKVPNPIDGGQREIRLEVVSVINGEVVVKLEDKPEPRRLNLAAGDDGN